MNSRTYPQAWVWLGNEIAWSAARVRLHRKLIARLVTEAQHGAYSKLMQCNDGWKEWAWLDLGRQILA